MERPWQAEQEVSPALARALIEAQFPRFSGASLVPFGEGWDNVAYLVEGRFVFRFPRRLIAVPLLETEIRVLAVIAPHLPLAVPRPAWQGAPGAGYPWPFAGYQILPGRTACRARLGHDARVRAAEPLAAFLSALHGISASEARVWGAPGDTLARTDVLKRVPQTRERLARVRDMGLLAGEKWPESLMEAVLDTNPGAYPSVTLVHGDLYARHLLVDEQQSLCGVIDWGDVHIGHPGLDVSIAYAFLPDEGRTHFFNAYGPLSEEVALFARFRALFSLLAIIVYGTEVGDADLVSEGRTGLRYLADSAT